MWARVVEFMLAMWLCFSPFIFGYPDEATFFWWNDFATATAISFFSLICFYRPMRKMHLLNGLVALYLIALAYLLQDSSLGAPLQNYMTLGILFGMICIVPSDSSLPPVPWRKFYRSKK